MGSRALGNGKWHSSSQQSKINEVTTTLVYPMTLTTTPGDAYGLSITGGGAGVPANQQTIAVLDNSGNTLFTVPIVGGPKAPGGSHRVYNGLTGSYAALNGAVNPPALELPDGQAAQGSKVWAGSGPPAYNLAQGSATAAIGDIYYCRSAAYLVASAYRNSSTTVYVGKSTPTLGTSLCANAAIANGDLVVLVANSTNATLTATMGATASVTATSPDGGLTTSNSTPIYNRVFSHVIQSGDIVSGEFKCLLSASLTGTGPGMIAYVFRHPDGWTTTGSLFGSPMYGTPATFSTNTNSTANISLTVTGPSAPTVSVASMFANASPSVSTTFSWNDTPLPNYNNNFVITPDNTSLARALSSAKPGVGPNQSAFPGMGTGNSNVLIQNVASKQVASLCMWQPNGTTNPIMYYCTVAGTPGTWVKIL